MRNVGTLRATLGAVVCMGITAFALAGAAGTEGSAQAADAPVNASLAAGDSIGLAVFPRLPATERGSRQERSAGADRTASEPASAAAMPAKQAPPAEPRGEGR